MSSDLPQKLMMWAVPVLLSLTVHEFAHAAAARSLGDDTAEREGRFTLNPVSHIDPIGTILMPLLQLFFSGAVFLAWAKPVPYNPLRFRRTITMSTGSVIVAAAGPLSNFLLALGAAVGLGVALRLNVMHEGVWVLLQAMFFINIGLGVFNLIPIPPLDGSKVLHGVLPRRAALQYEKIFPYAPALFLGFLFFGRSLMSAPISFMHGLLTQVTAAIAG